MAGDEVTLDCDRLQRAAGTMHIDGRAASGALDRSAECHVSHVVDDRSRETTEGAACTVVVALNHDRLGGRRARTAGARVA